jgi:hypothetical protein
MFVSDPAAPNKSPERHAKCLFEGMTCEGKIRLTTAYSSHTLAFAHAVTELHQKVSTHTKEEFTHLQRVADELRVKCEQARLALEQHTAAHGC